MLEGILSQSAPERPLLLLLNSNGGLPLSAERLVHVARTYAPKDFYTMVIQKAKSAATMVCLGSDKIIMTKTAELGPIDPQIVVGNERARRISVDSYLDAYNNLMKQLSMLDMNTANPVGLLHQLERFDAAHVEEMRKVQQLGIDITTRFLGAYMMKGEPKRRISSVVQQFSSSSMHKSHGRPIWATEAKDAGLNVDIVEQGSDVWMASYELVARYDHLCQMHELMNGRHVAKLLETAHTTHHLSGSIEEG
jgi:hypothetical protein